MSGGGGGGLLKDSESEDLAGAIIDLCNVLVSEVCLHQASGERDSGLLPRSLSLHFLL